MTRILHLTRVRLPSDSGQGQPEDRTRPASTAKNLRHGMMAHTDRMRRATRSTSPCHLCRDCRLYDQPYFCMNWRNQAELVDPSIRFDATHRAPVEENYNFECSGNLASWN